MQYQNKFNVSVAASVMLLRDTYEHDSRPNSVSATGLLRPLKQIIMSSRVTASKGVSDVSDRIPSAFGTAVHDAIEAAWKDNPHDALRALGWREEDVARLVVNPDKQSLTDDILPVYVEIRSEKEFEGAIITGKFDFVGDGQLTDHKTTGVYGYLKGDKVADYVMQGSIYKWLNPDIITADTIAIDYWFTDWSKLTAIIQKDKGYPQQRIITQKYNLLSTEKVEAFIKNKLHLIQENKNKAEEDLPLCTMEELWQNPPKYKYYKNPTKTKKSTANFDTYEEAQIRYLKDGEVGVIKEFQHKAKRCKYCNGVSVCKQAQQLIEEGLLDLEE